GQRAGDGGGGPTPAEPAEVLPDAQQAEGPGPGGSRLQDRRQGQPEVRGGPGRQVGSPRSADAGAEGPEGPPVRVLRTDLFQPAAVEAQEGTESPPLPVEGCLEERGVGRGKPMDSRPPPAPFFQD